MSTVALRPPSQVMRLARMGAAFPTRLSFMRVLIRRLSAEAAQVTRPVWNIDANGYGHAVYSVPLGGHCYSLVAFATPLEDSRRTDRVIAEAWDTSYVLYDGVPDAGEIARLAAQAPLQEAGRFGPQDLVLSRANKSVRLFAHVTGALSAGCQPDRAELARIGYLMRTTAVYGNGKFGIADRAVISDRPGLGGPFAAEMLTVWLIRGFTFDLVDHIAAANGGAAAARLSPALRRGLGIGNATGLGMAPFLANHPVLVHNWFAAREGALAAARGAACDRPRAARIGALIVRAGHYIAGWATDDARAMARIEVLRGEWPQIAAATEGPPAGLPERLWSAAEACSADAQELCAALLIESAPDAVDGFAETMADDIGAVIDPAMPCAALAAHIEADWDWALSRDYALRSECAQFWYVSEEKLEPRLGLRHEEPGADREMPLDIARRVKAAHADLPEGGNVAAFLQRHPGHRHAVRRVQTLARHPYAEIRDNLIGEKALAIDMLRAKLAFFGAGRFDPKSDRWTRVTLFAGAPLFDELGPDADDWWLQPPEGA